MVIASCRKRCTMPSPIIRPGAITLMATLRLSARSWARNTAAIPPRPSSRPTSNSPTVTSRNRMSTSSHGEFAERLPVSGEVQLLPAAATREAFTPLTSVPQFLQKRSPSASATLQVGQVAVRGACMPGSWLAGAEERRWMQEWPFTHPLSLHVAAAVGKAIPALVSMLQDCYADACSLPSPCPWPLESLSRRFRFACTANPRLTRVQRDRQTPRRTRSGFFWTTTCCRFGRGACPTTSTIRTAWA